MNDCELRTTRTVVGSLLPYPFSLQTFPWVFPTCRSERVDGAKGGKEGRGEGGKRGGREGGREGAREGGGEGGRASEWMDGARGAVPVNPIPVFYLRGGGVVSWWWSVVFWRSGFLVFWLSGFLVFWWSAVSPVCGGLVCYQLPAISQPASAGPANSGSAGEPEQHWPGHRVVTCTVDQRTNNTLLLGTRSPAGHGVAAAVAAAAAVGTEDPTALLSLPRKGVASLGYLSVWGNVYPGVCARWPS